MEKRYTFVTDCTAILLIIVDSVAMYVHTTNESEERGTAGNHTVLLYIHMHTIIWIEHNFVY